MTLTRGYLLRDSYVVPRATGTLQAQWLHQGNDS